jgi:hypothetical protein
MRSSGIGIVSVSNQTAAYKQNGHPGGQGPAWDTRASPPPPPAPGLGSGLDLLVSTVEPFVALGH